MRVILFYALRKAHGVMRVRNSGSLGGLLLRVLIKKQNTGVNK